MLPFSCLHGPFYSFPFEIFLHHLLDFIPLDFFHFSSFIYIKPLYKAAILMGHSADRKFPKGLYSWNRKATIPFQVWWLVNVVRFCLPIRSFLCACSLRLLAALDAGAFIVFSLTELGKHARLCTRTLEPSQCAVQRLIIFDADL